MNFDFISQMLYRNVSWINVAQDRVQKLAVMNIVMNLTFHKKIGEFLD
jgi:hypothetical protein